jgi:hypothetical protein
MRRALWIVTIMAVALTTLSIAQSESVEVPKFEGPIAITPTGQTPCSMTMSALFARLQIPVTHDPMLLPRHLPGHNTLIVAMGASLKGLGAAGIEQQEEMQRDHMVIDAAKAAGMKVIAAHIGGAARRNAIADRFITPFVEKADLLLVLAEGNEDGLFTRLSEEHGVPLIVVADVVELLAVLDAMFDP